MTRGSDCPWISFYPFNHENAFERKHLGYLPLVVISVSLYFISVEELVDGCQHCMQSLIQKRLKWNESYITRKGRMCVLRDTPWQQTGTEEHTEEHRGTHTHTSNIGSVIHSLHSFIHFPESLPDRLIQTYEKFIFSTSAYLYVLAMVSPQVNKKKSWTYIWYKALFCYHANFSVTLAQIVY